MRFGLIFWVIVVLLCCNLKGQTPPALRTRAEQDSAVATPQTGVTKTSGTAKTESYWGRPQKAALYSALLPGAGQVYNKEWWKVPILYTGAGVLTYFIVDNNNQYKRYNKAIRSRIETPGTTDEYTGRLTNDQVLRARDFYRRNRDFTIILTGLTYLLNVADAHVFAHLKTFNVSEELSMLPIAPDGSSGIALTLNFHLR
jgi:hypothetical protein